MQILIVVHAGWGRRWHQDLLERLESAGHDVRVEHDGKPPRFGTFDAILALEQFRLGKGLASRTPALRPIAGPADLMIDLTGEATGRSVPVLTLEFAGQRTLADGLKPMLKFGRLPVLVARLNGTPVGKARPAISDRLWLSRAATDILAGAISLIEQSVTRFETGHLAPTEIDTGAPERSIGSFANYYFPFLWRAINERIRRKRRLGRRPFYWQVGYRRVESAGVAGSAQGGAPFIVLSDDGERFYADPFVIEYDKRTFLFVEEFPYALGRGVVSVAELGIDGRFPVPQAVLQEPHHLSYPQVFEHDGAIWMLPESSASGELVLYRADHFPNQWKRAAVLLDRPLGDATLLIRDGRFWIFATERRGQGNFNDTLSVFVADSLEGPYRPHPMNPILIDRAAARPGGAFFTHNGQLYLPVQDCSDYYGGGLGLAELIELNAENVRFAPPRPVSGFGRRIHTLNRRGSIEVIDWDPGGQDLP